MTFSTDEWRDDIEEGEVFDHRDVLIAMDEIDRLRDAIRSRTPSEVVGAPINVNYVTACTEK